MNFGFVHSALVYLGEMKRCFEVVDTTAPTPSRSSESAKDCRKRKALRIQYLAESVRLREMTVLKMKNDIDMILELCQFIDQGEVPVSLFEKCGISLPTR